MKIRWTNNSVRFRITPGELNQLEGGGNIVEELLVAGGWVASVEPTNAESSLRFEANALLVSLSPQDLQTLLHPENEGVYLKTHGENPIRYFIEKDFPCAHPRASEAEETPTETFEPPGGFEERKNQLNL
jgi:hypothetical protein